MAEVVLFLSPHLDDAVLSCAGRIYTEAQAGRRVVVATVFSTGDESDTSREYYHTRRSEDRAALELLGAEPVWLDLPDAPFRRSCYRSFREIMLGTHPDDVAYTERVAEQVRALCVKMGPTELHAPLAVGTHIDHRLTHTAVRMQREFVNPTYYEDRPCALVKYATRMRLTQLGLRRDSVECVKDLQTLTEDFVKTSFLDSFDKAHWTQTYLPPGSEREACKSELVARHIHCIPERNNTYRPEIQTYDRDFFSIVIDAVKAYSSQFHDLFAGQGDFIMQTYGYSGLLGLGDVYAERYWTEHT